MRHFVILLVFVVLLVSGCYTLITGKAVDEEFYESNLKSEIYFCPKDNCGKIITNIINNAEKSVHCAFYDLDLKDVIKALGEKSHFADVKIVIDEDNYNGQIKGNGIRVAKSRYYMHNKFCIIDKSKVFTGSFNPTDRGSNFNNNNLIIIDSNYIAENYEDEFNELWNNVYSSGNNIKYNKIDTNNGVIENYFCPEDCKSESQGGIFKIINLIGNAKESVKVASFSFTHEELADELVKADIKGIEVKVLIESKQRNVQNSQYQRLRDFGVNIKVDGNKYNMHHKFIVVDNKIIITGSPNYSFSGNNRNDENMLVIYNENLALRFVREFDMLFDEGEIV